MNDEIGCLPTTEKGKMSMNEWENDDSDILRALLSVYRKNKDKYFFILVNLVKQRYVSSVKI